MKCRITVVYQLYQYISRTSASLVNTTMETDFAVSANVEVIIELIRSLGDIMDETPPLEIEPGMVRFGNRAYRDWFSKMKETVQARA